MKPKTMRVVIEVDTMSGKDGFFRKRIDLHDMPPFETYHEILIAVLRELIPTAEEFAAELDAKNTYRPSAEEIVIADIQKAGMENMEARHGKAD